MAKKTHFQGILESVNRTGGITIRDLIADKKHGVAPHLIADVLGVLESNRFIRFVDAAVVGALRQVVAEASRWPSYAGTTIEGQIERVLRLIDQPREGVLVGVPLALLASDDAMVKTTPFGLRQENFGKAARLQLA